MNKKYLIGIGILIVVAIAVVMNWQKVRQNQLVAVNPASSEVPAGNVKFGCDVDVNQVQKITFDFPDTLNKGFSDIQVCGESENGQTKYSVDPGPFTCKPNESWQETEQRKINGQTYCVRFNDSAGMGHLFRDYAYTTETQARAVTIFFSTSQRFSCDNYDSSQMVSACKQELGEFDGYLDTVVDGMMRTVRFIN